MLFLSPCVPSHSLTLLGKTHFIIPNSPQPTTLKTGRVSILFILLSFSCLSISVLTLFYDNYYYYFAALVHDSNHPLFFLSRFCLFVFPHLVMVHSLDVKWKILKAPTGGFWLDLLDCTILAFIVFYC